MIVAAHWRDVPAAVWRWPHFTPEEMACRGDGSLKMDETFLDRLESLRGIVGFGLTVNSGYRSPAYNLKVADSGDAGPHTTGRAVDFQLVGLQVFKVLEVAAQIGFTGIGLSQKGDPSKRFIHLDDLAAAPEQPRPWVWSY